MLILALLVLFVLRPTFKKEDFLDNLLISTNQSIIIIFPVSQKNDSDRLAQIFFLVELFMGKSIQK